jgi:hypothetical protein
VGRRAPGASAVAAAIVKFEANPEAKAIRAIRPAPRWRDAGIWRVARPALNSGSRPAFDVARVRTATVMRGCMCPNASSKWRIVRAQIAKQLSSAQRPIKVRSRSR